MTHRLVRRRSRWAVVLLVAGVVSNLPATDARAVDVPSLPVVSVGLTEESVREDQGSTLLRVTREGDTTRALEVSLDSEAPYAGDPSARPDIELPSPTVTFPAGVSEVEVELSIVDDDEVEPTETPAVRVLPGEGYTVGGQGVRVPILDDEPPTVEVRRPYQVEHPDLDCCRQTGIGLYRLGDLDPAIELTYTLSGRAEPGVDYVAPSGRVTMAQRQETARIDLQPIDDDVLEGRESIVITMSGPPDVQFQQFGDLLAEITVEGWLDDDEPVEFSRLAGPDRVGTAIQVSRRAYPDGARAVVVANAFSPSDAIVGAVVAASLNGPLLLTPGTRLAPEVADELARLGSTSIVLMGGHAAILPATEEAIRALAESADISRIAGLDRYETAAAAARFLGATRVVLAAAGDDDDPASWVDGAQAAWLAAARRQPVLLVPPGQVPAAVLAVLAELDVDHVRVVGGDTRVSSEQVARLTDPDGNGRPDATLERLRGTDRYATAWWVRRAITHTQLAGPHVWFATGEGWADVVVAVPALVALDQPLVLVHGADERRAWRTADTLDLRGVAPTVTHVAWLGGHTSLSPSVTESLVRFFDRGRSDDPYPIVTYPLDPDQGLPHGGE